MEDIYKRRNLWNRILLAVAAIIIASALIYSQRLAKDIADQEVIKVKSIAHSYEILNTSLDNHELANALEDIRENYAIPIIWATEKGEIYGYKNFDSLKVEKNKSYLPKRLEKLRNKKQFIKINYEAEEGQYLFYEESSVLQKLKWYPVYLIALVTFFIIVGYIALSSSKNAEQNRVWVGLAKETAHQLGTPISSISAWVDLLKMKYNEPGDKEILSDLENDITKLERVAERFSKIGSTPDLHLEPISPILEKMVDYFSKRSPKSVDLTFKDDTNGSAMAEVSPSLFEWVVENLIKNALDAIEGNGKIEVHLFQKKGETSIDITDSGKGIPKNKFKTVFEPGFSTKKRGWGLGLTLTKRIVESYHHGKIFVKESSIGKGTTFRIVL